MTLKFKSFSPLFSLLSSVTMGLTLCTALSAHFHAEVAQADEVAYLNMVQNTIEYPRGNVVGSVVGGVAVDRKGRPFSKSPIGVRTLQRDDGKLLQVGDDGTVSDVGSSAARGANDTPGSHLQIVGEELQRTRTGRAGTNVVAAEVPGVEGSKANDQVPFDEAESQDDKYAGNPNVEPARSVSDVLMTGGAGGSEDYNSHMDALDNWSQLYEGVTKSPLIVDSRKMKNKYPDLVAEPKESQRPQLGGAFGQKGAMDKPTGADLGADDEIMKTSMSVFQPIKRLQKDFLEDETARDAYLNSALTVRGIAVMTMGFLDKTVGAGLTAVQQQADMNTVQQLLKQISWTSSKMANGDRSPSYRDVDEKLEACLELALVNGHAPEQVKGKTRKIVDYKCSPECGEEPSAQNYRVNQKGSDAQKKAGNGSYA